MARVFVTGSSDGLGLMAGELLAAQGHAVTLHARNEARAKDARRALPAAEHVLVGDLSTIAAMKSVAEQANATGAFDAVIHNVGLGYRAPKRIETADGLEQVFAVNVLAPYVLTALMRRSSRLIYLSSGMHRGGTTSLDDPLWASRRWNGSQAYSDSKLQDVWLAFAIARRWPAALSNAVHPGWVPTKMGGPSAPDELEKGALTQAWLAVSDDPNAKVSGKYFFHQREDRVLAEANDPRLQDQLVSYCARLTGLDLPLS